MIRENPEASTEELVDLMREDKERKVIDLTQKQTVLLKHLNNISNREIAKQMHMSKDTINIS